MAEMVMNFVVEEFTNIKNFEENMQVLKRKCELLDTRKSDVLTTLEGGDLIPTKKRKREVEKWLKLVDEKTRQCELLNHEVEQTSVYNIVARRRLGKKVVQEIGEVAELVEQGSFPMGIVLDHVVVKESVPLVTFKAKSLAFERNFENIWVLLMDDEVSSIGIYGMGGVGKTTLAMHLHDKLLHEPKFSNCVYWVTVSQDSNIFKLQNDIARVMNVCISGEDDEKKRAAILFHELSKKEKFVLILDDVWKQFDLEKIGLPFMRDDCKFLLTSRAMDVCQRIGCQKLMKLEALSQLEAWELFREELGHAKLASDIEEIAKMVTGKCGGLPLGIITIARSMRGVTDIHGWKDALEELNESCMAQNDMKSEVLPILLYSFNRLPKQKLKSCFLYCSLYPEDYLIRKDELICRFIIEEIMDKRSNREAEFNQGHAILTQLENSCLLMRCLDFHQNECVKMHDLMREMALWITRENPRFMTKAGLHLKEIPADWKEDLNKVSLMSNRITDIPTGTISSKCRNLTTLILRMNPISEIPDSFFVPMCSLEILDLCQTRIKRVPNSVSNLGNLKALLLRRCNNLISLPSLKKLKELRALDLGYTNITERIDGMESLVNLKCLNLWGMPMSYMIPSGTLLGFSHLQRLILPIRMVMAGKEVDGLRNLEEFQGAFKSVSDYNEFIKYQNCQGQLSFYRILVGASFSYDFSDSYRLTSKSVILRKPGLEESGRQDEIMFERDIEKLTIEDCEDIKCITTFSSNEELKQEADCFFLRNLKHLVLKSLPNFMSIINWVPQTVRLPPPHTLSRLKRLEVISCDSIKTLLPRCLIDNLQNLEYLKVLSCDQMERIIGEDEGTYSSTDVTLPRLKELELFNLRELKSISLQTIICDSIVCISIGNCKKLKKIPLFDGRQSAPPTLKEIRILENDRKWWDSLEWEHFDIKTSLQPLVIYHCTNPPNAEDSWWQFHNNYRNGIVQESMKMCPDISRNTRIITNCSVHELKS